MNDNDRRAVTARVIKRRPNMQSLKELSKRRSVLFAKTLATNLRWSPLTPVLGGGARTCMNANDRRVISIAMVKMHATQRRPRGEMQTNGNTTEHAACMNVNDRRVITIAERPRHASSSEQATQAWLSRLLCCMQTIDRKSQPKCYQQTRLKPLHRSESFLENDDMMRELSWQKTLPRPSGHDRPSREHLNVRHG